MTQLKNDNGSFGKFWEIDSNDAFDALALNTFYFQYENNDVYRSFCDLINCHPAEVTAVKDIPHLPISFFKSKKVCCFQATDAPFFSSSTTTGGTPSKHYYRQLEDYQMSFRKGFEYFFGTIEDYTVLALLPSYMEREGSSLIYMADDMIRNSHKMESGFYLNQLDVLKEHINQLEEKVKKHCYWGYPLPYWIWSKGIPLSPSHMCHGNRRNERQEEGND